MQPSFLDTRTGHADGTSQHARRVRPLHMVRIFANCESMATSSMETRVYMPPKRNNICLPFFPFLPVLCSADAVSPARAYKSSGAPGAATPVVDAGTLTRGDDFAPATSFAAFF